jgi:hypothetical protein
VANLIKVWLDKREHEGRVSEQFHNKEEGECILSANFLRERGEHGQSFIQQLERPAY